MRKTNVCAGLRSAVLLCSVQALRLAICGENMEEKLKLYVWSDFQRDYTGGMAIAIAESEEEAMGLVTKKVGGTVWGWGNLEVLDISKCARYVNGGG